VDQPIEDNPRKRVKTELFRHKLEEVFVAHKAVKENEKQSKVPEVPESYNPYAKMEQLAESQKLKQAAIQPQQKPADHNKTSKSRGELLGEKPIKPRTDNQKFVRAESQELGCKA
jgi:hypothetical protein